jgi:hypothetical protein
MKYVRMLTYIVTNMPKCSFSPIGYCEDCLCKECILRSIEADRAPVEVPVTRRDAKSVYAAVQSAVPAKAGPVPRLYAPSSAVAYSAS